MASDPGARQSFSVSPAHLTMLVVCVVSVYFIVGFYGKSLDSYRINQRALVVRQEIAQLETQNRQLQDRDRLLPVRSLHRDGGARQAQPGPARRPLGGDSARAPGGHRPAGALLGGRQRAALAISFGHLGEWVELFLGQRDDARSRAGQDTMGRGSRRGP